MTVFNFLMAFLMGRLIPCPLHDTFNPFSSYHLPTHSDNESRSRYPTATYSEKRTHYQVSVTVQLLPATQARQTTKSSPGLRGDGCLPWDWCLSWWLDTRNKQPGYPVPGAP